MIHLLKLTKFIFLVACLSIILPAYAFSPITALLHQSSDPIAGNPNGKITIVEFFDYQCSHCIEMTPVMHDIINSNKNVRVVFKEFPIRGPISDLAAAAALAANKQGKYVEFNRALLMANQPLSEEVILDTAKTTGLEMAKLKRDMNSEAIKNQLEKNRRLGGILKITGTPAFFIGPTNAINETKLQFILGSMRQSEMQAAIDKANNE